MEYAEVKFNNGMGALLCNGCRIILATGFDHEDKEHFCPSCEESVLIIPDDILGELGWSIGTTLTVSVEDGSIILKEVDKTGKFLK